MRDHGPKKYHLAKHGRDKAHGQKTVGSVGEHLPRDHFQFPILLASASTVSASARNDGAITAMSRQTQKTKIGQVINTADVTAVVAWNGLNQGI